MNLGATPPIRVVSGLLLCQDAPMAPLPRPLYDDAFTATGVDAGVKLGLRACQISASVFVGAVGTSGVGYFATRIIARSGRCLALVPKVTLLSWSLRFVTLPAKENTGCRRHGTNWCTTGTRRSVHRKCRQTSPSRRWCRRSYAGLVPTVFTD
jgi:hypothetical protein